MLATRSRRCAVLRDNLLGVSIAGGVILHRQHALATGTAAAVTLFLAAVVRHVSPLTDCSLGELACWPALALFCLQ